MFTCIMYISSSREVYIFPSERLNMQCVTLVYNNTLPESQKYMYTQQSKNTHLQSSGQQHLAIQQGVYKHSSDYA